MSEPAVRVVRRSDWGPGLDLVPGGRCHPVIWPGMGANQRSMHVFEIPAGAFTVELVHPSEAVYYVLEGQVSVKDLGADAGQDVPVGGMFHVEAGTRYAFGSQSDSARVVGGPCPPDSNLYAAMVGANN